MTKKKRSQFRDNGILDTEMDLMEEVAGLNIQQIMSMGIYEFVTKYRDYYMVQLKALTSHDVHIQAKLLDYLFAMVRDMIQVTQRERETLQSKEKSDISKV